ncbi:FHA domain-containing protein [Primorskyibacter sp. 2E107]|uniref:FHA domain-containing protein n=1 Tax=Primorskyibacter sp. 2E107 TaxID=3403458 RepID=UPI003AF8DC13
MSSFRNIIARRRPSGTVEPSLSVSPDDTQDETAMMTSLLDDIDPSSAPSPAKRPPAPPEVPRWELERPRKTMGEELLGLAMDQDDADEDDLFASLPDELTAPPVSAPMAQAPAPATPAPSAPEPAAPGAARRRIWDIEPDTAAAEPPAAPAIPPRAAEPAPQAPLQPAPPRQPAAPAPARAGRVKTRLLGFHNDDSAVDAFAADKAITAPQSVQCPVGWIVIVDGPGRGASFALGQGLSTIGRGTDQTIALDFGDDSISRDNHASIAYDEEENTVLIGHGGKSNLVRLNGKPLVSSAEMQDGDQVRIGKTTLRFVALCGPDFRWTRTAEGAAGHD